ncbi:hypothetical protein HQ520_07625 [bacterium]|nr:hypothetical protein [bacterium]
MDRAFSGESGLVQSFADLGGVWGVHGAYTFYTLHRFDIRRAVLADCWFSETVMQRAPEHSHLELVQGDFRDSQVRDRIGRVDALFLFDVLLHQVHPDWNEVLEMYAGTSDRFLIFNQQYIESERTVRLLDLGEREYFENVPHDPDNPAYRDLFERLDLPEPGLDRTWRESPSIWQWGITDLDLREKMSSLGFKETWHENCGQFMNLKRFENHAFLFERRSGAGSER